MNQAPLKETAIVTGGNKLPDTQPMQFGFTNTAAMKQTLFSRMSPNATRV